MKNALLMLSLFLTTALSACTSSLDARRHQITSWNFDWDDNVFYMPTRIHVFHKKMGYEKEISTEEFAEARHSIGRFGEYADYELRNDDRTGSFREFRDKEGHNVFLEGIQSSVSNLPPDTWMGPSWHDFVDALEEPLSAAHTSLITARDHSSESLLEGLKFLQEEGYLHHLPHTENLVGVSNPKFKGDSSSPSEAKTRIMKKSLDLIESVPIESGMMKVVDRDGKTFEALHLWGFSDDDFDNFEEARKVLSEEVAHGKWPHVKITLNYTGRIKPDVRAHSIVITSKGEARDRQDAELGEAFKIHAP